MLGHYKLETVLPRCFENLGEAPHWDPASQKLLCVDILHGGVLRWDPVTNDLSRINLDGVVGFVIPRSKGGYVVGLNKTIAQLDFESKDVKILATVDEGLKTVMNDAKCDASGRLWAGTYGYDQVSGQYELGLGSLYTLSKDHKVTTHLTKLGISNGLDWTADNSVMYFIDSPTCSVVAFDFDLSSGTISNRRVVVQTEDDGAMPDGMCVDAEGKLWVAFYGGGKVCRFDPENGKTLMTIKLPVTNITSCCFGGKNLDELYITSALPDSPELIPKEPLAGSLFRVTGLGVKGRVANNFEG